MNAGLCKFFGCCGLSWLHLKQIVEAVEVVEEADGGEEFDDFSFGVEAAEVGHFLRGEFD